MNILKFLFPLNIYLFYRFELFNYIYQLISQSCLNDVMTSSIQIEPQTSVLIAGGGLSGLALALALKSSGIEDVLVIERAPALRTKSQGAIRISTEGLASLGVIYPSLPDTLRSLGAIRDSGVIRKEVLSNGTVTFDYIDDPHNGTGVSIAWADIQNTLANAIRNVSGDESWLRCGSGIKSYNEKADRIEVKLDDGSIITTSLLVGADGTFSTVRRQIKTPLFDLTRSYSQTNWNAIIPRYSVPEIYIVPERTFIGIIYVLSGAQATLYNIDIGKNRTFWQLRITDEKIAKAVDSTGRGGAGLVGVKQRILDIIEKASQDTPFADFSELRSLVMATDSNIIFERRMIDRKPLKRWSSRRRRVVLMGDAAHAMHPAPGQGANTAFADVVSLATSLKKGDLKNPANSVKQYENERIIVANKIQARSRIWGLNQAVGIHLPIWKQIIPPNK
jgi:2-polyprenyl-6-methoxyphenol hydroxylase-like FAD-dependent oxidoreductase